jgi:glycosyltransferase involved in cell wall biosynthesis
MIYDVSAIIPVLGPQPLLQRAIESVLANPGIRELFVVDDGSFDPLALAAHPKLEIIRHDRNKGAAAARNTGARAAKCEWLAFLDAD